MHRPPRPISKQSKLQPSLHQNSTDPPKLIKSIQPFQIVVSKFNTVQQCIGKSGFKYIDKKTIQIENNNNQMLYPTVLISPKITTEFIHNIENQQLHKINKPVYNSFKIRHLSSQGKRSKQIVQHNQNNVNNKQNLNCNTKAYSTQLKRDKKYTGQKTSRLQTDTFIQNKNQQNFRNIVAKTGIWKCKLKQNIQNQQKISFIIPQSLFQQSIVSPSTISILKNLVMQITKIQCSSILQLSSNKSVKALQQIVQTQKINISYIIWNSNKYVQSLNILNLMKIQKIENFVVIVDNNSNVKDFFIGSTVQRQKKRRFMYWGLGEIGELLEIVRNVRVNIDDQCNICSISYRISQPINITQKLLSNPQLLHKTTLHQIPSNSGQTQHQSKLNQHLKTFDEQYRNKMVQLVKILHQQHKTQQPPIPSKYNNNNQYMKLYINQQVMEIMDCYVSNTTAYQFGSEIVRNNMGNFRQIMEYRNRSKYMDKDN